MPRRWGRACREGGGGRAQQAEHQDPWCEPTYDSMATHLRQGERRSGTRGPKGKIVGELHERRRMRGREQLAGSEGTAGAAAGQVVGRRPDDLAGPLQAPSSAKRGGRAGCGQHKLVEAERGDGAGRRCRAGARQGQGPNAVGPPTGAISSMKKLRALSHARVVVTSDNHRFPGPSRPGGIMGRGWPTARTSTGPAT